MYTIGQGYMKFVTVSIGSNISGNVRSVERAWKDLFADKPFDYFFLDQFFNRQYSHEMRLESLFLIFSALSIFIACLGLFGFSYFVVYRRIREIGIRKILGANPVDLMKLLGGEFLILILVAEVMAIPLVYHAANSWLTQFAYRIEVAAWYYLVPAAGVIGVALFTIGLHLVRVIRVNPVENLRNE